MNMEEEFISAIEKRDTEILQRDQTIALQKQEHASQIQKLASQKQKLASQKQAIAYLEDGLKTAVKTMLKNGMTKDMVSQAMNLTVEEITRLTNA